MVISQKLTRHYTQLTPGEAKALVEFGRYGCLFYKCALQESHARIVQIFKFDDAYL